jgi:thiol-disulfide isomerase/thioredoxin
VLLNFWAGWCEPCLAEMPSLAQLAARERPRGLRVVAANYRESVDAVRRFLAATPLALDIALDRDGAVAKAFGVHAFPSTVAIDRGGRVRFVVMGECDWSDARSRGWVDDLLGERR